MCVCVCVCVCVCSKKTTNYSVIWASGWSLLIWEKCHILYWLYKHWPKFTDLRKSWAKNIKKSFKILQKSRNKIKKTDYCWSKIYRRMRKISGLLLTRWFYLNWISKMSQFSCRGGKAQYLKQKRQWWKWFLCSTNPYVAHQPDL